MSEVKKYECTVLIDASCGVTVEASSPEEAAELAENAAAEQGAGSLCHQCSGHTECGDSYAVIVYDGDKEVLDTDHRSKLLSAAQSELAALREELATITADRDAEKDMKSKARTQRDKVTKRLADAERRNATLITALTYLRDASDDSHVFEKAQDAINESNCSSCGGSKQERVLGRDNSELVIDCSICTQPTESGASE